MIKMDMNIAALSFSLESLLILKATIGFCSMSPNTSSDDDSAMFDCRQGPSSASWVSDH